MIPYPSLSSTVDVQWFPATFSLPPKHRRIRLICPTWRRQATTRRAFVRVFAPKLAHPTTNVWKLLRNRSNRDQKARENCGMWPRLVGVANNNKDSRVSSRFHCTAHLTALHSTGRQPLSFISQISLLITLSPIPILCSKQSRWFEQWLMERKVNNKRNHFEYKTFSVLGQFVASPLLGKNNLTPMLWW